MRDMNIVHLIDWYDGLVAGVVRAEWLPGPHLCTMLMYDAEKRIRIFALLPLSEQSLEDLRSLLDSDWDSLVLYLKKLWACAEQSSVLVCRTGPDERIMAKTMVDTSRVRDDAVNDIERATDEAQRHWDNEFRSG